MRIDVLSLVRLRILPAVCVEKRGGCHRARKSSLSYRHAALASGSAGRSFDRRVGQVRIPEGFRPNHQFNSRRAVGSACRNERALWGRLLTIPGLHDNLACDFSALKIDHRRAEYAGSIGIRTALREGETLAYGDAAFDLVSHVAPADVIKIGRDRTPAFQVAWFARRIVTINYLNNGIFIIQGGKRVGVAAFDRTLEPSDGDGLGLGL